LFRTGLFCAAVAAGTVGAVAASRLLSSGGGEICSPAAPAAGASCCSAMAAGAAAEREPAAARLGGFTSFQLEGEGSAGRQPLQGEDEKPQGKPDEGDEKREAEKTDDREALEGEDGEPVKQYPPADPALGTLEGRVILKGPPPPLPPLEVPSNHQDHASCKEHVKSEVIIAASDGSLKNVVVHVKDFKPEKRPKPREAVLDNRNCLFVPHVQATTVGSTFRMLNSDSFIHNTRGLLALDGINIAIPPKGAIERKLNRPGWGAVKCDFHVWMDAHVHVFPHELFDVTGKDGRYRIVNIPPGTHEIAFVHERLAIPFRPLIKKVTIEAGKTTALDIELEAPKQ
jgi:hypothetical protein